MAILFDDASTESLTLGSAILTAAPMSVSAWVYPDANVNNAIFNLYQNGSSDEGFGLWVQSGNSGFWFARNAAANASAASANTATLNAWNHIVGVEVSSSSRSVRLNGGTKVTDATSMTPAGLNRTAVGTSISGAGQQYMSGRIAELAVWNVALDDDEQIALSKRFDPMLIRPASLVVLWRCDRNSFNKGGGSTTLDNWKNGYNLTEVNTPALAEHAPMIYKVG